MADQEVKIKFIKKVKNAAGKLQQRPTATKSMLKTQQV